MDNNIKGLTNAEVRRSLEEHGNNSLLREKTAGFFTRFFENLTDPIIKILMLALIGQVIFSFGNCNYFEIGGILSAILISATVSTVSEYRSERAFEKLEAESASMSTIEVLRDDLIVKIACSELVIGDVVYLYAGNKIPADGRILSGKISVDQSALNGESAEYTKAPAKGNEWDLAATGKVFRGAIVTDGSAIMRVERIGAQTYYGRVASDIQSETRISPLKLRLGHLAKQISRVGYVIALLVGITFLFKSIIIENQFDFEKIVSFSSNPHNIMPILLESLTLMITVIVVAAPEGLPMMITVVLSANMKKMLKDNIFVKKLVGIETAGSLNILFTDKTGTITYGRPICERIVTSTGVYYNTTSLRADPSYEVLSLSAKYNTDITANGTTKSGGNATDKAIYDFFENVTVPKLKILNKVAFKSETKVSSASLSNGLYVVKGAVENILAMVGRDCSGSTICDNIYKEYKAATAEGKRVIAVAAGQNGDLESLEVVAIIVMKDQIRPDVINAVSDVTRAGIQIVMLTGDGKDTAVAIARECGIIKPFTGQIAISSDELHRMSDEEIKNILPKLRVVARALPQDKIRLVRLSQELDLVVGMTGDGINDAPSLKLSDVGFAMGSGTDIAKSASDVIIVNDSFSAIGKSVLYGRTIFKSIRKFIAFQLTMNLVACGVSLVGQFVGIETPITIIQMLWINIIMDTLGGLAFAGESPQRYYMHEKPKRRNEAILSAEMIRQILAMGIYTLALCISFLTFEAFKYEYFYYDNQIIFLTAFYALFIFAGIFNCFVARSERLWIFSNISKNKTFVTIMCVISAVQLLMIYRGGDIFRCAPMEPILVVYVIAMASSVILFDFIRRLIKKLS